MCPNHKIIGENATILINTHQLCTYLRMYVKRCGFYRHFMQKEIWTVSNIYCK
jgi:hypothetical protein